jgi:hypothetical protein
MPAVFLVGSYQYPALTVSAGRDACLFPFPTSDSWSGVLPFLQQRMGMNMPGGRAE